MSKTGTGLDHRFMTTSIDYPSSVPDERAIRATPPGAATPAFMIGSHLDGLRVQLERLRSQLQHEVAQSFGDARSYGGGSNNDEYQAALEDQMVLSARIAMLERIVDNAIVVDPGEAVDGVAAIGATVLVEDFASRAKHRYRLTSAYSRDPGSVSASSPMGQALIGAKAGDVIALDLPNGSVKTVRLFSVTGPRTAGEPIGAGA